mmetsp:Transcript_34917/g.69689  ORF Transcript_34917/g.69689 Transcript_34917/m.69689 type:complete len:562 (-) Transcript_34917:711-2396(-)
MDAEPLPQSELCQAIQKKLQRWGSLGEAPEYFALRNRGPHKATVSHPLNRFGGNMGPYADSLLPLKSVEYINASPIDNVGEGSPWFVATMCPKRDTYAHFWSMVWELGSRIIINLTHERDRIGSGPADKRERYWPPIDLASEKASQRWAVQPRTLFTESCEQVPSLLRFAVELTGPPDASGKRPKREVALYWYSRWVDFPSSTSIGSRPFYANAWAVLHIAMHVASEMEDLGPKHWTVCHCSAGVGRTGTFIALVNLLRMLPELNTEGQVDQACAHAIEAMRERRLWMVKTDIEYASIYAALLLRIRNPDAADFALTWPLSDGGRPAPDDTAKPTAKPTASPPSAMAVDGPVDEGVGTLGAQPSPAQRAPTRHAPVLAGSTASAAADGAPSERQAPALESVAAEQAPGGQVAAPKALPASAPGSAAEPSSTEDVILPSTPQPPMMMDAASGSTGGEVGGVAPELAEGLLEVRTPEDDEMEVEAAASGSGYMGSAAGNVAVSNGPLEAMDDTLEADAEIDNAADVAHYANVGESAIMQTDGAVGGAQSAEGGEALGEVPSTT